MRGQPRCVRRQVLPHLTMVMGTFPCFLVQELPEPRAHRQRVWSPSRVHVLARPPGPQSPCPPPCHPGTCVVVCLQPLCGWGSAPSWGQNPSSRTLPAPPEAKGHNSEPNLRPATSSCAWAARVVPESSGAGKGGARERQGSVQDPSTWDKARAKRCHVQVCKAGIRGWGGQQLAHPRAQLTGRLIALLDAVGTGLPRGDAA